MSRPRLTPRQWVGYAGFAVVFILTASVGLCSWVDQQENAVSMLGDAELAMYRAKRAGRNQVSDAEQPVDDPAVV